MALSNQKGGQWKGPLSAALEVLGKCSLEGSVSWGENGRGWNLGRRARERRSQRACVELRRERVPDRGVSSGVPRLELRK